MHTLRHLGFLLLLVSCASTGIEEDNPNKGPDSNPPQTPPDSETPGRMTGEFHGIAGIYYVTDTQSGTTNESGEFWYLAGETVEFFVGDVSLGSAQAAEHVSVFDLAGIEAPPVGAATITKMATNPAFQHAVNLAVFLTSFDDNETPYDGVVITPEVSALFAGVELDFRVPYQTLNVGSPVVFGPTTSPFRNGAFTRAFIKAQEVFSVPHAVISAPRAMQTLYVDIGVDPGLFATKRQVALNSSGKETGKVVELDYTPYGYLEKVADNSNTDTVVYDENGNRLEWTSFSPSKATFDIHNNQLTSVDSATNSTREFAYDERGFLSSITHTNVFNGETSTGTTVFSYNDKNQLIKVEGPTSFGMETDLFEYDERYNMTKFTRILASSSQSTWIFSYDENNRLVMTEIQDAGGEVIRTDTNEYDARGNLVVATQTEDDVVHKNTYSYDDQDRLVSQEGDLPSNNGNSSVVLSYDDENRQVQMTRGQESYHLDVVPVGWGVLGHNLDTIELGNY